MWFYAKDDQQIGPVPQEEIDELIEAGVIQPTTLVWKQGMVGWQQARLTELASNFPPSPPQQQPEQPPYPQYGYYGGVIPYETYRSLFSLTSWLRILICFSIGLTIAMIFVEYQAYRNFTQADAGTTEETDTFESADAARLLIAVGQFPISLVSAVLFFVWVYRANKNVRALGAYNLHFTPGWAVGWFFIPFANLVMPYLAVLEITKASKDPPRWFTQKPDPIVHLWWLLVMVALAVTIISVRYQPSAFDPDIAGDPEKAALFSMVAGILEVARAVCVIIMITRVLHAQTDAADRHLYGSPTLA